MDIYASIAFNVETEQKEQGKNSLCKQEQ